MNRVLSFNFKNIKKILLKFWQDHCLEYAAALTYATVLSLVPIATISFSILGGFALSETKIRTFLLKYFLPESSLVPIIENNIERFIKNTTTLNIISIIALLIIAIALLSLIETIFNRIWQSTRTRPIFNKFVIFWAVLTLTPLLLASSLGFITRLEYFSLSPLIISFFLSTTGLFFLYRFFPFTKVSFKAAIIGSFMASIFFEIGKWGFRYYIHYYASFDKIYGTLATVPIFLVWLYWIWVIILLGAEIAFFCDHPFTSFKKEVNGYNLWWPVLIILEILSNFQKEKKRLTDEDLAQILNLPLDIVNAFIHAFTKKQWLTCSDRGTILPNTPLEKLPLQAVLNINHQNIDKTYRKYIKNLCQPLEQCLQKTIGNVTLGDLLK
jgi:membrane protein